MTMHMAPPGLSTINTKKSKRKPSVSQLKAKADHELWLTKHGIHPQQLASKSSKSTKLVKTVQSDKTGPQCSNGFALGGAKTSVFDSRWKRTYDDDPLMAAREEEALARAEAMKSNLAPLYNKGPVQVVTPGHDQKSGNGRGRN